MRLVSFAVSAEDRGRLREQHGAIAALRSAQLQGAQRALSVRFEGMNSVDLPPDVAAMVLRAADMMAQGYDVALFASAEELTTSEAAKLIGCSRPHVCQQFDSGLLDGRWVGSHRRVRTESALLYRREREGARVRDAARQVRETLSQSGSDPATMLQAG